MFVTTLLHIYISRLPLAFEKELIFLPQWSPLYPGLKTFMIQFEQTLKIHLLVQSPESELRMRTVSSNTSCVVTISNYIQ